jgi:hypothetical protein
MIYMLVGFVMVVLIMGIRYLVAGKVGTLFGLEDNETVVTQFIFAAGLPSFLMTQLPLIFDPDGVFFSDPGIYADLCMPIVLGTVAFSAFLGTSMIIRRIGSDSLDP